MEKELLLLREYCEKSRVELDLLLRLEEEGLIETEVYNDTKYLPLSQLNDLELFIRLYYELSVNIEGIDIIHNLLTKIQDLERELTLLRRRFSSLQ